MNDTQRLIVRGFLRHNLVFEEPGDYSWEQIDAMAHRHAELTIAGEIDLIEIEFPNLPEDDRFLRLGTNPRMMIKPLRLVDRNERPS